MIDKTPSIVAGLRGGEMSVLLVTMSNTTSVDNPVLAARKNSHYSSA